MHRIWERDNVTLMASRSGVLFFLVAALAGCAVFNKPTTALKPGDYVITGPPAGFYSGKPRKDQKPELELKPKTRVTLVKQAGAYSLVKLEDRGVGYVATASLATAPAKAATKKPAKPAASPAAKPKPQATPNPAEPAATPKPTPAPEPATEASSTPTPEVPQFRY